MARAAWIPTIPNTPLQVVIQSHLSTAVINWRTVLTEENRQAWNEYALTQRTIDRLGETRIPNGYNLYIGRQIQSLRISGPLLPMPPDDNELNAGDEITIVVDTGGIRITWRITGWFAGVAGPKIEGWAAGPYSSQARNPTSDEWRFVEYRVPPQRCRLIVSLGEWWWLRIRAPLLNGRVSSWLQGQALAQP